MMWRTGRKLGRTLYMATGEEPSDQDEFLGIMETRELAQQVADAMNAKTEVDAGGEVDRPEEHE